MAMYSTTLFIVETSLSGFFGSGERHTSAVDRQRCTYSSETRPGNSTTSVEPELDAERAQVLEGVAAAHEDAVEVLATVAQLRHRTQGVVDTVLRAHHAEVGEQVLLAALQRGVGLTTHEPVQVRAAADHDDVGRDRPSLGGSPRRGSSRWWRSPRPPAAKVRRSRTRETQ